MPQISVSRSGSGPLALYQALSKIRRAEVLVGVSQKDTQRRGTPITNASLVYIHTHGSPARNIPARPIIEPAIEASGNREVIAEHLGKAAKAWLDKDPRLATVELNRAGMAGQNAAKGWFTDPRNRWAEEKRATVLAKLRRLRGKRLRAAKAAIAGMDTIGYIPGINEILVDTGAMKKAIKYIVRENA